jgi:hypothetical protein
MQVTTMTPLGILASGEAVYDRYNSHSKLSPELLREALGKVSMQGEYAAVSVEFDRVVGATTCVKTTKSDRIIFAHRPNRRGRTRFVLDREPEPTQTVSLVLKRREQDAGEVILISSWCGALAEPEPWDANATPNSEEFWATHALIWGCA